MRKWNKVIAIPAVLLLVLFSGRNLPARENGVNEASPKRFSPLLEICSEQNQTIFNPKLLNSNTQSATQHPKFGKAEALQSVYNLQMPFIANEGQTHEQVMFYANTFGGTVFVTKGGEIVYSLMGKDECQGPGAAELPYGPRITGNGKPSAHEILDVFMIPCSDPLLKIASPSMVQSCRLDQNVTVQVTSLNQRGKECPCVVHRTLCTMYPYCTWNFPGHYKTNSPVCHSERSEESHVNNPQSAMRAITLKEEFVNGKIGEIQGIDRAVTKVNYFRGNDPSLWKKNISTYDVIALGEVYEGIELKLKAYGNNVEKLFYVKPGADPNQIKIRLSGIQPSENPPPLSPSVRGTGGCPPLAGAGGGLGARGLSVNKHGELEVETELGPVKFTKPVAYQEIDGKRVEVECQYTIADCGITHPYTPLFRGESSQPEISNSQDETCNTKPVYGFTVASYDRTKELVIDPLLASTYLGGNSDDRGYFLTLDTNGSVYVTAPTGSSDFPTTSGAYDTSYNSGDVFVSKLDSGLTTLLASTFLGGADIDSGGPIAIDTSGNVYVTGFTDSSDFPTTSGAHDTSINGNSDVFVSKLDSGLTTLLASTFLGGTNYDVAYSIAIDVGGNVVISGRTFSADFPTTPGAYDTSFDGSADAFVSMLDGGLTSLLASTYLGGANNDYGNSLALNTSGNIYVTGYTGSTNFPTTPGAYDTSFDGAADAFVSKFNSNLTNLMASTFMGGWGSDVAFSLAIDSGGDVHLTGVTTSSNFPTTPGAYDTTFNDFESVIGDVFVSRLNGALTSLLASTFLGGQFHDIGNFIAIDSGGNVFVTGYTYGQSGFPTTPGAYDTSFNGYSDAFVSKFNSDLTNLMASTFLGGISYDEGFSMAIDSMGNVLVVGVTSSLGFPSTPNAYDTSFNGGGYDAFISKFDRTLFLLPDTTPPAVSATDPSGDATGIDVTGAITATFSEVMNATTINTNTFTVRDNNLNSAITGTVSYSGMTATFTPSSPLAYSTTYTATLTTGVTDLAGNAMAADYTWNFTTRPLPARYTSSGMTIDGMLSESGWSVSIDATKVVNGATNNTAQFGVLWDPTYLYVGMKVLDDNLYNDSGTVWHDDSIEVSIDGDHNHSTAYDSHDRRFNKGWNDASLYERSGNTTGVLHGWASIPGGYTIELAIPWSSLGVTPAEGMTLGLSAGYSDDDNGGNREGKVIWIGNADSHNNPSSLGHVVLADSIAHYALNEGAGTTAVDSSVYGKDGTISGAAWTTGKEGGGLSFNGTSDSVSVPRMNSEEISVSAWFFKHANDVSYTDAIVGGFRNDQNLQLREGFDLVFNPISPNSLDFVLITRDGSGIRTSRTARRNLLNAVGSWYHAVGTYQKATGQQKLYVNGELVRTVTHPAGNTVVPMTYYPEIMIGHSVATTGYFSGIIDDVRLYDRVLSDKEIKGLYHAFSSELQAHYALDENTGTTANDSSGNGNHGSVNGGATWTMGRYGGGLGFDGTNDYVSVPRSNHDEVSVCAWFKKNSNDTTRNDAVFGAYRHNSSIPLREGFEVRFAAASPNTLDFVLVTQDGSGLRTARTSPWNLGNSVGSWYYVAGTYSKTTGEQKLYVNGQLVNTQTHPAGNTVVPLTTYTDMRIGHSRVNAGYFNGVIDDVRIYNRALSEQEVLDVYNNF